MKLGNGWKIVEFISLHTPVSHNNQNYKALKFPFSRQDAKALRKQIYFNYKLGDLASWRETFFTILSNNNQNYKMLKFLLPDPDIQLQNQCCVNTYILIVDTNLPKLF